MTRLQRWEKWLYRLTFAALFAFLASGAWVVAEPTDARTDAFGVVLYVTLILAVTSGLATIYASSQRGRE